MKPYNDLGRTRAEVVQKLLDAEHQFKVTANGSELARYKASINLKEARVAFEKFNTL